MSFNIAIIYGHLGKDPEIRSTSSGKSVASFSVATDSGWGENKDTFWANIVAFGQQAEFAQKWLKKGSLVRVTGELRQRKWTDKSGSERATVEITAKDIAFGESKGKTGESRQTQAAPRQQAAPQVRQAAQAVADSAFIQDEDVDF